MTTPDYAKGGIVTDAPARDSGKELQPLLDQFCQTCGVEKPDSGDTAYNPWEVYENIARGREALHQFSADMLKYCPEWNNREIAKKKLELYFAYSYGEPEDIHRIEKEIETLTDRIQCHL